MKTLLKSLTLIIITCLIVPTGIVVAQEESNTSAELAILPENNIIPPIIPNENIYIKLNYTDTFGINWSDLQYFTFILGPMLKRPNDSPLVKIMSFIITRIWWPNFRHRNWKPFLGYTSVLIETEILGNPNGWTASINPSTIPQSTNGTTAKLTLRVHVDALAAENTATVIVKATRILKDGSNYGTSYFYYPVKSEQLYYLDVKPTENTKEIAPDAIVTFNIDITNLGYFVDNFVATVNSDDSIKALLSDQSFVLNPGETRTVVLFVYTEGTFFDPGTSHTMTINAYSLKNPEQVYNAQIQVVTKGFYLSQFIILLIISIIILFSFIYLIYYYLIKRKNKTLYDKPQKPWTIPEEREYLTDLKQNDKVAYEKELDMMEDEYKSALLWYKYYREAMKRSPTMEPEPKPKRVTKKSSPAVVPEEKKERRLTSYFKRTKEKPVKKEEIIERPTEAITQPAPIVSQKPVEQKDKDKVLQKIRREQEKQKKRLKQ